jgi:hypothetical protein
MIIIIYPLLKKIFYLINLSEVNKYSLGDKVSPTERQRGKADTGTRVEVTPRLGQRRRDDDIVLPRC